MSNVEITGSARGAFAEAAERFDKIARVVKDQQLSDTRTGPRAALTDSMVASPEEAWAKKFMTQAIGPAPTGPQGGVFPVVAPQSTVPHATQDFSVARPSAAIRPGFSVPAAIGEGLGKAPRKRTWLGWLLLGR